MSKWLWVFILSIQAHFAASYLVPLWEKDQVGLLRWVWPWGVGDKGLLGQMALNQTPLAGLFIAMASAASSILAALSVLGIWIPNSWWRHLAIAGAALELVLMVGFLGVTKLLPIVFNLAVLTALWRDWAALKPGQT